MRDMVPAFRRAIFNGRSDYTNYIRMYNPLNPAQEILPITDTHLVMGSPKMDDAVSDDNVFQVGAVIVNSLTFALNNMDESYSDYVFEGWKVVWYVGMDDLDDGTDASYLNDTAVKMGSFIVSEAEYDGNQITLHCLDYASKLDKPFDWSQIISFPCTVGTLILEACSQSGVNIRMEDYDNIPHTDYRIFLLEGSRENVTCRQVMSWAAQIVGCYARCDADGYMVLKWFDTSALTPSPTSLYGGYFDDTQASSYESGDTADGGSFNPWNTGDVADGGSFTSYQNIDLIKSCFSQKLSVNDIEITGVKVSYKTGDGGQSSSIAEATIGTAGYMISIEDNPLINTLLDAYYQRNTVQDILGFIGSAVIGMTFRTGEIIHPSDPAIEAGDVGYYWDTHGNQHSILISSTEFQCSVTQRTVSSAASKENNASTRYSNTTQNYVNTMAAVALAVYPVGSIYMSVNGADPATLFGGTWEQLQNRFLLGAGSSYVAGNTGGEATHTLTTAEMPSHSHKSGTNSGHYAYGGNTTTDGPARGSGYRTSLADIDTSSAGGGGAHNNMPPYLVVYMWKRTA